MKELLDTDRFLLTSFVKKIAYDQGGQIHKSSSSYSSMETIHEFKLHRMPNPDNRFASRAEPSQARALLHLINQAHVAP